MPWRTNLPETSLPPARTSSGGQRQGRLGLLRAPANPHHTPTRERAPCLSWGSLRDQPPTTPLSGRRSCPSRGSACCRGQALTEGACTVSPKVCPPEPCGCDLIQKQSLHMYLREGSQVRASWIIGGLLKPETSVLLMTRSRRCGGGSGDSRGWRGRPPAQGHLEPQQLEEQEGPSLRSIWKHQASSFLSWEVRPPQ